MALQPTFQDTLHLVMWNGFAADCATALATCKETWTDDRVWYPFGINLRYGPQQKTRLQIISDHCIPLDNGKKTIIRDEAKKGAQKPKLVVYKTHEYFVKRVEEFRAHAEATHHQKAFQKALDARDAEGKTLLIHAAIKKNIRLADFLIKNGVDVNLLTNRGGSAACFAWSVSTDLWWKIIKAGGKYESEQPLPIEYYLRQAANPIAAPRRNNNNIYILNYINDFYGIGDKNTNKKKRAHDEKLANPPPHVKASLFKKQFGRK